VSNLTALHSNYSSLTPIPALKASYRLAICSHQQDDTAFYNNDLHESLVNKHGSSFWKCWKSKVDTKNRTISHVDGTTDSKVIVQKFVEHFTSACSPLSQAGYSNWINVYTDMRPAFAGNPLSDDNIFDAELIENSYSSLKAFNYVILCFLQLYPS